MKDFPKWMLALAGFNLLPLLLAPFYLFGGLHPFGTSEWMAVSFVLYLLTNLIWLVPVWLFFVSLDFYRRGYERIGVAIAIAGALLTVVSGLLLIL